MYTRDIVLSIRPFTRQQDGDEVVIGSPKTGVFLALPAEAVELLDQLAAGHSIGEVADRYRQKYGETPDLEDFLSLLETKGFVAVPGETTFNSASGKTSQPKYHFSNFPQPLAKAIFSRPVLSFGCLLILVAAGMLLAYPTLRLEPSDLVFPDHRALCWTLLTVATYVTIFVHEFGHLVAARAEGVSSRMGISNRLWYLVAETDMTGLWAVARKQRYLPLLAGILIDAVSCSLLIIALFSVLHRWLTLPALAVRLMRAMAFTYFARILWEFFLFVRTDIYYVIATYFNCKNLLSDTQAFIKNLLARVFPSISATDLSAIPRSELRTVRAYSVVMLGGRIWALFMLFWATIPVCLSYFGSIFSALSVGYSRNPSNYIDALVMAAYFLVPTIAGFVFWIAAMHRRARLNL